MATLCAFGHTRELILDAFDAQIEHEVASKMIPVNLRVDSLSLSGLDEPGPVTSQLSRSSIVSYDMSQLALMFEPFVEDMTDFMQKAPQTLRVLDLNVNLVDEALGRVSFRTTHRVCFADFWSFGYRRV